MPFTNPARTDGAVFHHWRRVADEGKEYPFAKFNKVIYVASLVTLKVSPLCKFDMLNRYSFSFSS